ncbi:MAG: hypothetical protein JW779_02765 [Candidatus Thorarchaeota archaeon]|nr:hypothetical protein [Candidatus Thorarchaeota archaeon]
MIVPGTTISLTLLPTFIEVRDKGIVKKKVPLKSRSYDDIVLELQKYFRYLGKRLAPGVLEDVLHKIGVPKARRIIPEPELEPEPEPEIEIIEEEVVPEPVKEREVISEPPKKKENEKKKEKEKKEKQIPAATFVEKPSESADEKGVISADDFDDISDALKAVESLSDSFMTGTKDTGIKEVNKPEISINLKGQEEIVASGSTYVREPYSKEIASKEIEEASEEIELIAETIEEIPEEEEIETPVHVTPTHQIKPIVECKALLLGETGVGKRSLQQKAGLEPIVNNEETGEVSSYIFGSLIDCANHRIRLNVWSFDVAVKAKVPRKDFYDEAQLLIIVYAASDRWSFESIDFWLREASISCENNLPIVIAANKIDLRSDNADDSGEEPVTYEEGFQLAEELAKRFGVEGKLHPVAFIETSCISGENTMEVFKTAAQLFENNLK